MFALAIPIGLYFFSGRAVSSIIRPAVGLVGVAALYILTRNLVLDETFLTGKMEMINNSLAAATDPMQRYGTIFKIFGKYLILLLFPVTLSSDYSFNQVPLASFTDTPALVSLLIIVSLLFYALYAIGKKSLFSFAFLLFLILLLPASNLFIMIGSTMGERFLYAPSLGFAVALLGGVSIVTGNGPQLRIQKNNSMLIAILGCIILLYTIRTAIRLPDWKDTYTLVAADVQNAPNSARLHLHLAKEYTSSSESVSDHATRSGLLQKALSEYHQALNIYPGYSDGWYNLGHAFDLLQSPDSAYRAYQQTIRIDPRHPQAYNNLGVILFARKEYEQAFPLFQKALSIDSLNLDAMGNVGAVFQNLGKRAEALKWYDKALAINPNLTTVKTNRSFLQ
jgi:tetratricopeptide (TPR) repeat protein